MTETIEKIDYNKLNIIKEELLRMSEEYLYSEIPSSSASKVQEICKMVGKQYDF